MHAPIEWLRERCHLREGAGRAVYAPSATMDQLNVRADVERCFELRAVAGLTWGQVEVERMAVEIGLEVDFGRETAA